MTVRVMRAAAGGRAVFYHVRPSTGQEHRFRGFVRANATHVFAYCHLCDAWSAYPRIGGDPDAQRVAALVGGGQLTAVAVPDDTTQLAAELDIGPLKWAREDGHHPLRIPLIVDPANTPARVQARRDLCAQLRQHHADQD